MIRLALASLLLLAACDWPWASSNCGPHPRFVQLLHVGGGVSKPDFMALDEHGNVWVKRAGGCWTLD